MRRYTRYVRWGAESFTFIIILVLGALNLALYGGFLVGEEHVSRGSSATLPEGNAPGVDGWRAAELDSSTLLPGMYVPAQGRSHIANWSPGVAIPFCEADEVSDGCYASNPPTSGQHIGVLEGVRLEGGQRVRIPPDPGVYSFAFPKEAIPHIEEHAGVFVGYNCESALCDDVIEAIRAIVEEQVDDGARVVMAPYPDLPPERVGLASWTRYEVFAPAEYSEAGVRRFIEAHSCRVDYENLCD